MKKILSVALAAMLALSLIACNGGEKESGSSVKSDVDNSFLQVEEGYTKLILEDVAGVNSYGAGVEFDPHFFSQNVTKGIAKDSDWSIVEERVGKMGIDTFRVMILPSWLEPFNDNDNDQEINWSSLTTESVEMQSLYKVLDLAEANDIKVNLVMWGVEHEVKLNNASVNAAIKQQGGHFLAKGNETNHWIKGTIYPEELAENFAIYLELLINQKGYDCIDTITPINEGNNAYFVNSTRGSWEDYAALAKALHNRLIVSNLRERVQIVGSDNTEHGFDWLANCVDLGEVFDMYSSHTYKFGYGSTNDKISEWEIENRNRTRHSGKAHIVGEFGSNLTSGSTRQEDVDEYRRGVLLLRQLINFYNAGAAGVSYWILFDEYYNHTEDYPQMMQLGLWRSTKQAYVSDAQYYATLKEDYEVRPHYYAYSLVTKHLPLGAEVYPIATGNDMIAGAAFKGMDGKWTYVFANGSADVTAKYAVHNPGNVGEYEMYVYDEYSLPQGDALIEASSTVKVNHQVLSFAMTAQSAVILKEV